MIDYRLDPHLGALRFKVSARLDIREFRSVMDELLAMDYDRLRTNFIWDLRDVDVSGLGTLEVMSYANFSLPVLRSHGEDWKSALVVSTDLQYGLARMLESFIFVQGASSLQIFRSMEAAALWLVEVRRDHRCDAV